MLNYIIRRLLYTIPVLFAASFLTFTLVALASDPLQFLRMQPRISQETLQKIVEREHLDEPIIVRYGYWLKDAASRGMRHICWDGCMFPNAMLEKQDTWNTILAAMVKVREAHGWK